VTASSRNAPTGFTLIEVIVALAILSLILLITVSGLRTLGATQGSLEKMTDRVDEVRTVSSFLRDTLESAVIGAPAKELTLGGYAGVGTHFFEMSEDALAWKSNVLFGENFGGTYFLKVAKEDNLLMLRWLEPEGRDEPGDWTKAQSRVLVNDLEEFALSYRSEAGGNWRTGRVEGSGAVVLRMQIKASGRYWPDLIMQVPR
jgi:general secretion pathway protein J